MPLNLAGGILLGAGLASAVILLQYFTHVLTITGIRPFLPLLPNLWNTFVNSIVAETLIIGIFFRLTEEWLGSWLALLILAMLFVILHITAPGATIISAIAVSMHSAFCLARRISIPAVSGSRSPSTLPGTSPTPRSTAHPLMAIPWTIACLILPALMAPTY